MSDGVFYGLVGFCLVIVFVGIWFVIGLISSMACESRWPDRNPSWAWFQGCMIDTDEGRIPSSNYRVL